MTDTGFCSSCRAPILWAMTLSGKRIPLDPDLVPGGNIRLDETFTGQIAVVVRRPSPDVDGYRTHFATCPQAVKHRRSR